MALTRKVLNRVVSGIPDKSEVSLGEIVINNLAGRETLYIINDRGDIAAIQTGGSGEGGNPNSVLFVPQTLSNEEKMQIFNNITVDGKIPNEYLPLTLMDGITLGESEGTAYEGSKGKANADEIAKLKSSLATTSEAVGVLVGDDKNMTIRQIAVSELTNQLLTGKADADFKTLKDLANWLEGHPETVASINSDIKAISGKTSDLEKAISANTQNIVENNNNISAITTNVTKMVEHLNQEFEDIDQEFEGIDQAFEDIGQEFGNVYQKIDDLFKNVYQNLIKIAMPITQAQYDAMKEAGRLKDKTLYIIKDDVEDEYLE